jgi:hypothetical protein
VPSTDVVAPQPGQHGAALPASGTEPVLLVDAAGTAIALARMEEGGLRVVRGFIPNPTPVPDA